MESGHAAGLQSSRAFADAEAELYRARRRQAQEMVDEHGMGETTYRDRRSGRSSRDVVDVSFEKLQQQQQVLLNQGRVQREAMERHQQEMAVLATSSFSRYENDEELEALRRSAIREGDPMAASSAALAAKTLSGSGVSSSAFPTASRPVYKGPPPKPNRFGIRPGFRWDGEDRGNGFEDRLLARRYSQQHQRELSYRLSSTDM
jgi:pre-mRNA-splicing factor CWC26